MTYRRAISLMIILLPLTQILLGCDYARMKDQESVRTYEEEPPEMPEGIIPTTGGSAVLKTSRPEDLRNPLPSTQQVLEEGRLAYSYFCIMCHGQNLDGNGTVGQSFNPIPANLRAPNVQQQSDGQLFYKMSFGYGRHPPLSTTISEGNRWAILRYIRSFQGERS